MEKVTGYVTGVNGNLVSARFSGSVRKNEVGFVKIGNDRLKGEVIRISGDAVSMQIYEMTNGIQCLIITFCYNFFQISAAKYPVQEHFRKPFPANIPDLLPSNENTSDAYPVLLKHVLPSLSLQPNLSFSKYGNKSFPYFPQFRRTIEMHFLNNKVPSLHSALLHVLSQNPVRSCLTPGIYPA